ncbi:MAG: PorP/SprF family type IX secretion system membrane protein [Microscillaceae bacterium]|nr:PorP/SprF family type IX secretion system membrane protein [Microscillaceae bacterium]
MSGIVSWITLSFMGVKAQDPHFSQFYAASLSVNPAFTGTESYEGRFTLNYRSQWPKLSGEFVTYQVNYDHQLFPSRNSLGFYANLDQAGSAGIRSVNLNVLYAYTLPLSELLTVKAGMQLGYGNRNLDYYKLVFGDQLSNFGATGSPSAEPNQGSRSISYIDVGVGFLAYTKNFWLGISGHHLNQPNQSLGEIPEKLPVRWSIHTGYKFAFYRPGENRNKDYSMALNPAIYYSQQGAFKQLDAGANFYIDPIILGVWYRGLPIQKSVEGALVGSFGFKYKSFKFVYGYDMPLGKFAAVTGGAHEFSIFVFVGDEIKSIKSRRRSRFPAFPSLMH